MKLLTTTIFVGILCLTMNLSAQDNFNPSQLFAQNEFSSNSTNDLLFVCRASIDKETEKEEFKSGILIDYNNVSHKVEGHYDVLNDEMKILLKDQKKTVFPQKILAIKVGEMIFVPCEFEGEEALIFGYFQVLSGSKIDLLMRYENNAESLKKIYYTRKKDEAAKILKINKKSICKSLNDSQSSKYLKDEKLNLNEEEDLIKLFDFYNSKS